MTAQTELATKVHAQETLSSPPTVSAANSTATSSALEYGATAATRTGNAAPVSPFADTACASLGTARFRASPRVRLRG